MLHRQLDCGAVALGERRRSSNLVNDRCSEGCTWHVGSSKHCASLFSTLICARHESPANLPVPVTLAAGATVIGVQFKLAMLRCWQPGIALMTRQLLGT
jgi:hypothetical protein